MEVAANELQKSFVVIDRGLNDTLSKLVEGSLGCFMHVRLPLGDIYQNLFFALIYNAAGVPLAAGILYPVIGLLISPMFAAFAMSASSISVVLNSLRLRTVTL